MDNMRARRGLGLGGQPSRRTAYEDFQPSHDWTQDSNDHILLIDLSGFKRENIKLQVDTNGKLMVQGERRVNESKYSRFKQEFTVPADSNIAKLSAKFENGLLFVIMPKKEIEKKIESQGEVVVKDNGKEEEKTEMEKRKEPHKEVSKDNNKQVEKKEMEEIKELQKELVQDSNREMVKKKEEDKAQEIEKPKQVRFEGEEKHEAKEGQDVGKDKEGEKVEKKDELPIGEKKEDSKKEKQHGLIEGKREKVIWGEGRERMEDLIDNLMDKMNKNKAIIATALVAFSLGLIVSCKLR